MFLLALLRLPLVGVRRLRFLLLRLVLALRSVLLLLLILLLLVLLLLVLLLLVLLLLVLLLLVLLLLVLLLLVLLLLVLLLLVLLLLVLLLLVLLLLVLLLLVLLLLVLLLLVLLLLVLLLLVLLLLVLLLLVLLLLVVPLLAELVHPESQEFQIVAGVGMRGFDLQGVAIVGGRLFQQRPDLLSFRRWNLSDVLWKHFFCTDDRQASQIVLALGDDLLIGARGRTPPYLRGLFRLAPRRQRTGLIESGQLVFRVGFDSFCKALFGFGELPAGEAT